MSRGTRGIGRALVALAAALAAAAARAAEPPLSEGLAPAPPPARTGYPAPEKAEPPLPPGLGGAKKPDEPALPPGLGGAKEDEPALPPGLDLPATPAPGPDDRPPRKRPFDLAGFWELRGGLRTQEDPREKDESLGETRLQLQFDQEPVHGVAVRLTGDLLYDLVANPPRVDLEEGRGMFDLREAWVSVRQAHLDLKLGRQVLTWGTGDLIFINDLFPKDYNSFFIGRDTEYLKAPSDAVKASFYTPLANTDIVYTPRFDADRFIDGRRLSYYSPLLGRRAGRDALVEPDRPDTVWSDDELAVRVSRAAGAWELAAYGYDGYWKSPAGYDPRRRRPTFPALAVYGASARGPAAGGIAHFEAGWYDSLDDSGGRRPFVPNSQVRLLAGYEREAARNFTVGVQYYVELMMNYGAYRDALPPGAPAADEDRHTITLRLTRLLLDQNLELGVFTFFSPTDGDVYMRPRVKYKIDDHWSVEAGANVFFGNRPHTFFGQFQKDSNLYVGVRYGF